MPVRPRLRVLLLFAGVVASSLGVVAGGSSATDVSCPKNTSRDAIIVVKCGSGQLGPFTTQAYLLGGTDSATLLGGLPRGALNVQLSITSDEKVDLLVVNGPKQQVVAGALNGSTAVVHDKQLKAFYENSNVTYSGSDKSPEFVKFQGRLAFPLDVIIVKLTAKATTVTVTYQYEGFESCTEPPTGCRPYDKFQARDTITRWSRWASKAYPNAQAAWDALAKPVAEKGIVPFHKWLSLRGDWRSQAGEGQCSAADLQLAYTAGDGKCLPQAMEWTTAYAFVTRYGQINFDTFKLAFDAVKAASDSWYCFNDLRPKEVSSDSLSGKVKYSEESKYSEDAWDKSGFCSSDEAKSTAIKKYLDVDGDKSVSAEEYSFSMFLPQRCPTGQYRNSGAVYHCMASKLQFYQTVLPGETAFATCIPPKQVKGLKFDTYTVKNDEKLLKPSLLAQESGNSYTWVTQGVKSSGSIVYQGMKITMSRSSSSPYDSSMAFNTTPPTLMSLWLENSGTKDELTKISYQYDTMDNCSYGEVASCGCGKYDVKAAFAAAYGFSLWLNAQYSSSQSAWDAICKSRASSMGFPVEVWRQIWRKRFGNETSSPEKPAMASEGLWQSFAYFDANRNLFIDRDEFGRAFDLVTTFPALRKLVSSLYEEFQGSVPAFASLANGGRAVTSSAWSTAWLRRMSASTDFCNMDLCGAPPAPQRPQAIWTLPATMIIYNSSNSSKDEYISVVAPVVKHEQFKIGKLDSIGRGQTGLAGSSFTFMVRAFRGYYPGELKMAANKSGSLKDVSSSVEVVNVSDSDNNLFATPLWNSTHKEQNRGIAFGVRKGKLYMSFGKETCRATVPMPSVRWVNVAFVYSKLSKQMSIVQDGVIISNCTNKEPLQSSSLNVWVGARNNDALWWVGKLGMVHVYSEALTPLQISGVFGCGPTFNMVESQNFDGKGKSTSPIGSTDDLGLNMGNFTLLGQVYRHNDQQDAGDYAVIGSESLFFGISEGKLSIRMAANGTTSRCSGNVTVDKGVWVKVAAIFDAAGGIARLFQDGVWVGTCSGFKPLFSPMRPTYLGRNADALTDMWKGMLKNIYTFRQAKCMDALEDIFSRQDVVGKALDADRSFHYLDTNHDGMISKVEFEFCFPPGKDAVNTDCFPSLGELQVEYSMSHLQVGPHPVVVGNLQSYVAALACLALVAMAITVAVRAVKQSNWRPPILHRLCDFEGVEDTEVERTTVWSNTFPTGDEEARLSPRDDAVRALLLQHAASRSTSRGQSQAGVGIGSRSRDDDPC